MTTTNFCKKMSVSEKIKINAWAKFLEADEIVIHKNGSVSLYCKDGIICENYYPSAKELHF